jgi:hypothetical protein
VNEAPGFFNARDIESFQIPYKCEKCGKEIFRTIKTSEAKSLGMEPPPIACECGGEAPFDEVGEDYFGFLKK